MSFAEVFFYARAFLAGYESGAGETITETTKKIIITRTNKTTTTTIAYRTKSDIEGFASMPLLFNFGGCTNISLAQKIEMFINFL